MRRSLRSGRWTTPRSPPRASDRAAACGARTFSGDCHRSTLDTRHRQSRRDALMTESRKRCCNRPSTCCDSACTRAGSRLASQLERVANTPAQAAAPSDRCLCRSGSGELLTELSEWSYPRASPGSAANDYAGVIIPLRFVPARWLSFSTTTIFGTPVDITLSEIALESFFPADAATARRCVGPERT